MAGAGWPSKTGNPSGKGRDNNSSSDDDDDWVDPTPWSLSWHSSSYSRISRYSSAQQPEPEKETATKARGPVRVEIRRQPEPEKEPSTKPRETVKLERRRQPEARENASSVCVKSIPVDSGKVTLVKRSRPDQQPNVSSRTVSIPIARKTRATVESSLTMVPEDAGS